MSLSVLLVPYPGTWKVQGGHRTQQLQTARALARAGVHVAIGDMTLARSGGFDVVHFFGDPRPLLGSHRPPGRLVVSPVHFPAEIELGSLPSRAGRLARMGARLGHFGRSVTHPRARLRRRTAFSARLDALAWADVIITNSRAEADLVRRDAGRRRLPAVHVAHSGVDAMFFRGDPAAGRQIVGPDPFVLCVGRVEPIKNQVTLCRAMRGLHVRLVLVGAVLPGNERYLETCRRELPSLLHIPHVERELLPHVYAAAQCHVLPSWFETTGLATLEALAAGTPCIAARGPCVEDYFANQVEFAPPGNPSALSVAIRSALERPRGTGKTHAAQFSWDRTACELLQAYGTGAPA